MVELQDLSFESAVGDVMASLTDRIRVRRPPGKRTRIKHGQINMPQAENTREAWLFSIRNDAPLNTFATVHWGHAPAKTPNLHPVDRNGLLRDGLKAWFYRHAPGVPFPGSRFAKRRAPLVSMSTWWPTSLTISASGSPRPLTAWSRTSPPASARQQLTFVRLAPGGGIATPT